VVPLPKASSQETIALFDQYVIPNYGRFPISLTRGEGSFVWDAEGNRYLDLFQAGGVTCWATARPRSSKPCASRSAA